MTFLLCGLWTVVQLYIACVLLTCESGSSHIFIVIKSGIKCPHVPWGRAVNLTRVWTGAAHKAQLSLPAMHWATARKRIDSTIRGFRVDTRAAIP